VIRVTARPLGRKILTHHFSQENVMSSLTITEGISNLLATDEEYAAPQIVARSCRQQNSAAISKGQGSGCGGGRHLDNGRLQMRP
jgi:hypothetical protein